MEKFMPNIIKVFYPLNRVIPEKHLQSILRSQKNFNNIANILIKEAKQSREFFECAEDELDFRYCITTLFNLLFECIENPVSAYTIEEFLELHFPTYVHETGIIEHDKINKEALIEQFSSVIDNCRYYLTVKKIEKILDTIQEIRGYNLYEYINDETLEMF